MSGTLRPARPAEIDLLWPAVRAAHLMADIEELRAHYETGPWRVQVTDGGEAAVLARWRAGDDVLAIKGLWASEYRVGPLVDDVCALARAQGFARVLSPLVGDDAFGAYRRAGMVVVERLVALQAVPASIELRPPGPGLTLSGASADDLARLGEIDAACFEPFWRYGHPELAEALRTERLTVVRSGGVALAYATCARRGATVTLGRLAVDPAARRRGIAAALVTDAAGWAARAGCDAFSLCTQEGNDASRALYARCGLHELSPRFVLGIRDA